MTMTTCNIEQSSNIEQHTFDDITTEVEKHETKVEQISSNEMEKKHLELFEQLEQNPLLDAFTEYVNFKLSERDLVIAALTKQILLCLDEIKQINLLLTLSDKIEK